MIVWPLLICQHILSGVQRWVLNERSLGNAVFAPVRSSACVRVSVSEPVSEPGSQDRLPPILQPVDPLKWMSKAPTGKRSHPNQWGWSAWSWQQVVMEGWDLSSLIIWFHSVTSYQLPIVFCSRDAEEQDSLFLPVKCSRAGQEEKHVSDSTPGRVYKRKHRSIVEGTREGTVASTSQAKRAV